MLRLFKETTQGPDKRSVILGVIVLLSLLWHGWVKYERGLLIEMVWVCHVSALMLGVGLILRQRILVGVGFIFFAGAGMPLYLLDNIISRCDTTLASFVEHVICPIAGLFEVWRSGIPRYAFLIAWVVAMTLQILSYHFTPAALNINLAHKTWGPLAALVGNVWIYRAGNALVGLVLLYGIWRVIDVVMRWLNAPGWRPPAHDPAQSAQSER